MAERRLEALSPLGGIDVTLEGVRLREVTGLAAVLIAAPAGSREEVEAAVRSAWGCRWPEPGGAEIAEDGAQILWWGPDQALVMWEHEPHGEVAALRAKLGDGPVLVEQGGALVTIELAGARSRDVLERLCPPDPGRMSCLSAQRTGIEHMGATVLRLDEETFRIISASSSAWSLWHEVARAAEAVV